MVAAARQGSARTAVSFPKAQGSLKPSHATFVVYPSAKGGPAGWGRLFGPRAGHASNTFGMAIAGLGLALAVWQYRVLTRPDVRKLFGVPGA
jgi:hypothetical protein